MTVEDEGVLISWTAELSEGKDRLVTLKFGAVKDGLKGDALVEERLLLPGITFGAVNIGFQDGQVGLRRLGRNRLDNRILLVYG